MMQNDIICQIKDSIKEKHSHVFVIQVSEVPDIGQNKSIFVMDVIKQMHVVV